MRRRRVVITGLGILSAHGNGVKANQKGFKKGIDSTSEISAFDVSGYRGKSGGELRGLPYTGALNKKRARRLDRSSLLLLAAFEEAILSAGLERPQDNCLLSLGTTLGGMISGMRYHRQVIELGFEKARPGLIVDYLAHNQAENLMREFDFQAEAYTFSDACASSSNSIGFAFHRVRSGDVDMAVAGGYDTMCEFTVAGFNALQAISVTKCRPFDMTRDGLILGEGAALIILEEMDSALKRGAKPLGEIIGYGASSDAFHSTRPDPEAKGAVSAIRAALDDAGTSPHDIDYINAHGTATPYNDVMEARAIREVFGEQNVPVSSIKPMVGHTLGASGAVEAVATVLALKEGFIPPNINYVEPDPECGLHISTEPDREALLTKAVSNSFGFGGANAVLVFQAPDII